MSLEQIITTVGGGFLGLLTLIQWSPIKINPWTWIARKLGKAINGEVVEKVNALSKQVNDLAKKHDEDAIIVCRARILRFNDELLCGDRHTQDHFEQILMDITSYEHYCDENKKFKNGVAVAAIKNIHNVYQRRLENRDFL